MALFRCTAAAFAAYRMPSAGALYFDAPVRQSTYGHWRIQLYRRGGVRGVGYGSYKRFCRHYSFRHWVGAHCSGKRAILLFAFSENRQRPPDLDCKKTFASGRYKQLQILQNLLTASD